MVRDITISIVPRKARCTQGDFGQAIDYHATEVFPTDALSCFGRFIGAGVRPYESVDDSELPRCANSARGGCGHGSPCSRCSGCAPSSAQRESNDREAISRFVGLYCVACHNRDDKTGGLALDVLSTSDVSENPKAWESVVHKLVARQMPPPDEVQPPGRKVGAFVVRLVGFLDRAAADKPDPGRTAAFRRLTRTEYQYAIRDLLSLDIDATALLPKDESTHGFDNITVGDLSPTLLDRYITAAQKISRLAVGGASRSPGGETFRIRPDLTQEEHVEGLPIGTRGGALDPVHISRRTATTTIQVRWHATATSTSRACASRMNWRCCLTASEWRRSRSRLPRSRQPIKPPTRT